MIRSKLANTRLNTAPPPQLLQKAPYDVRGASAERRGLPGPGPIEAFVDAPVGLDLRGKRDVKGLSFQWTDGMTREGQEYLIPST